MKYAIITTGSKQYSVREGDQIDVELIEGKKGDAVSFTDVLLIAQEGACQIAAPGASLAAVQAQIIGEVKGPKEVSFKYKKRKNYRRKVGHRQRYTRVKITTVGA